MEKKDITSLLDALCERPLAEEAGPLSPEQEAFYRRALEALASEGGSETAASLAKDPEALAAVLAAIHAGAETEAEREDFARAAAGFADVRLDSESALAFLDRVNEAPESAPAHLLAPLETVHSTPAPVPRPWSFALLWPARRGSLRWAGAFAVLVVAGGLSWSTFRQGAEIAGTTQPSLAMHPGVDVRFSGAMQSGGAMSPSAMTGGSGASAVQAMSNKPKEKPKAAVALAKPCQAGVTSMKTVEADKGAVAQRAATLPTAANSTACDDADRRLADKDGKAAEQLEALRHAQEALKAEIARRQAEAANRKAAEGFAIGRPGEVGAAAASRPSFGYGTADSALPAVPPAAAFQQAPPAAAIARPPSLPNR